MLENRRKAEDHWNCKILHSFNRKEFEKERFVSSKLDLEKKGYFVLEDLVRFLNMETGTFYRNRDLYLIFRRLTKTTKIDFDDFMDELQDDIV